MYNPEGYANKPSTSHQVTEELTPPLYKTDNNRPRRNKSGINTVTDGNTTYRVPTFTAPRLTNRAKTGHIDSTNNANSEAQGSSQNIGYISRQTSKIQLSVFRKDRRDVTREDQISISVDVISDILEAINNGKPELTQHGGTVMKARSIIVYCTLISAPFFKQVINKIKSKTKEQRFECFLPGETLPGHRIHCDNIPEYMTKELHRIIPTFCAGTIKDGKYMILPDQVSVFGTPVVRNRKLILTLELDNNAFKWLKTAQWTTPLGFFWALWGAVPVPGVVGYIPPDKDPQELKNQLLQQAIDPETVIDASLTSFPPLELDLANIPLPAPTAPTTTTAMSGINTDNNNNNNNTPQTNTDHNDSEQEKELLQVNSPVEPQALPEQQEEQVLLQENKVTKKRVRSYAAVTTNSR